MVSMGAMYHLIPRLWGRTEVYSLRLVSWHVWLATLGIVVYASAMWVSGIMQGLMWREYDEQGFLVYSFAETVAAMHPYYVIRAFGGLLFLVGSLIMVYNLYRTIRGATPARAPIGVPAAAVAAE
jgi:cytochrome c oxidase cbb3-type subunit 1